MALNAGTVWEIRATGAQTNGGGFYDRNPGTSVDYSQQDAAQLSLSDIATDVAGTTLTSATGGFTAAMAGNIIYLTGGGATAGWYEIVTYTDTNNVVIDRTAGSSKSNVTGNVGGAFLLGGALDDDFGEAKAAGNIVYIKAGSHSLGENFSPSVPGTITSPIQYIGYNASRGDNPTGNDRPLIACGAYYFLIGTYYYVSNLRFTGTSTQVAYGAANTSFVNCKAQNTSGTAGRSAFYATGVAAHCIQCEGISDNGFAFYLIGSNPSSVAVMCYAHDSVTGFQGPIMVGCFADTCSTQGVLAASTTMAIVNCTIYGCGIGVTAGVNVPLIINNIVSGNTTGLTSSATYGYRPLTLYNNTWYNTSNFSNASAGADDLTSDPLLNDPANGDFALQSGSPCFDAGLQPSSKIGIT